MGFPLGKIIAGFLVPFLIVAGFALIKVLDATMENFWDPANQAITWIYSSIIVLIDIAAFIGLVIFCVLFVEREGFGAFKLD